MSEDLHRRLYALEAELASLKADLVDGSVQGDVDGKEVTISPDAVTSRRQMLRTAAAGIAGAIGGAAVLARPAAAATNDNVILGQANVADAVTSIQNNGPFPDLTAPGPIALKLQSAGGHIQFVGALGDATRGGGYPDGTMTYNSSDGLRLWFSSAVTRIVSPTTMPIHPLDQPVRIYDSRRAPSAPRTTGPIHSGESRGINAFFDEFGVGNDLSIIASSGALVNVTIVNTVGAGFLTVRPPSSGPAATSTINWTGPGQVLANMAITKLSEGSLQVVCGGGSASTDFVIDVMALLG